MNLYLKYRPKKIEELDLTKVRERLQTELKSNKLAHAYLFTGPRGAGKTSAARILARVINCEKNKKLGEPCNECGSCMAILDGRAVDVIEIDAASNRGIDDVRELKDKIRLAPSQLKKKVYIVDEVHMMTTEAFNALLKTLEEPPEHALFILCTTEAHKVPETIASRCSRILFTKATEEEMLRSFERVVKGERGEVSKEALMRLAKSVDGSFRDGVKILDQLLSEGKVELARMEEVLYGAAGFSAKSLAEALAEKQLMAALSEYRQAVEEGVELSYLGVETMKQLKELLLSGKEELAELIFEMDEVVRRFGTSQVPQILMEVLIIKWCGVAVDPGGAKPQKIKQTPKKAEKVKVSTPVEFAGSEKDLWQEMLKGLNGDSYSLGALLARARPGVMQGNELIIQVEYEFHKEQIMSEKHRARIEELVSKVVGQPMRISCEVKASQVLQTKADIDRMSPATPEEEDLLEAAEDIFGNK